MSNHDKVRFLRATQARWLEVDPVLDISEPGHEVDTDRFKIGDGVHKWSELDYFEGSGRIRDIIRAEVDAAVGAGGTTLLADHINSETPHPVYDDGPSLLLLYKNAKV